MELLASCMKLVAILNMLQTKHTLLPKPKMQQQLCVSDMKRIITDLVSFSLVDTATDYLWTANEVCFHRNSKLLGLSRQFGHMNFGAFGVLSANFSAPILVQWVPCPCFPSIGIYNLLHFPLYNHYFNKKHNTSIVLYIKSLCKKCRLHILSSSWQ